MKRCERVIFKRQLLKMGFDKTCRKAYWEYIYRQEKSMPWDNRACYGVGLFVDQEMVREGFDYMNP